MVGVVLGYGNGINLHVLCLKDKTTKLNITLNVGRLELRN